MEKTDPLDTVLRNYSRRKCFTDSFRATGVKSIPGTYELENFELLKGIMDLMQKRFDTLWEKEPNVVWTKDDRHRVYQILRSILTPILFLTNWSESRPHVGSYLSDQIGKYILNIRSLGYNKFFNIVKEFYQTVLSLSSPDTSLRIKAISASEKFLLTLFGVYSLHKIFRDLVNRFKQGQSTEIALSINFMKRGFPVLTDEQKKVSVQGTLDRLTTVPNPISATQIAAIDIALRMVIRDRDFQFEYLSPSSKSTYEYTIQDSGGAALLSDSKNDYISNLLDEKYEHNYAKVVLLDEANKVRFLTIQSSRYQNVANSYKVFLLENFKKSKFSTMNENWKEEFLQQKKDISSFKGSKTRFWFSGDYTAATDNLEIEISEYTLLASSYMVNMNDDDRKIILDVLKPRLLEINKPELGIAGIYEQMQGQMMGNPLSFGLLCIINLATVIETLFMDIAIPFLDEINIDVLESLLQSRGLRINGDDMTAHLTLEEIERFRSVSSTYGLKLNYKSIVDKNDAQINSVYFKGDRTIPYLNQAILFDNNIKNMGSATLKNLGMLARYMYDFSPQIADIYFLATLRRLDPRMYTRDEHFKWALPERFGGFDYPIYDIESNRYLKYQLFESNRVLVLSIDHPKKIFNRLPWSYDYEHEWIEKVLHSDSQTVILNQMVNYILFDFLASSGSIFETKNNIEILDNIRPLMEDPELKEYYENYFSRVSLRMLKDMIRNNFYKVFLEFQRFDKWGDVYDFLSIAYRPMFKKYKHKTLILYSDSTLSENIKDIDDFYHIIIMNNKDGDIESEIKTYISNFKFTLEDTESWRFNLGREL